MRRRGRSGNISNNNIITVPSFASDNRNNTNANSRSATTAATIVVDAVSVAGDNRTLSPPPISTFLSASVVEIATKAHDHYTEMSHSGGGGGGSRKDDPVFNVKFVQLVERHPCLWNSSLPEYSKKEETQNAWESVANDTKDTVRNCRERWRTIRSSFLRSLKQSRTNTGRGKRKYYLSKYLQFLTPYTKTRPKSAHTVSSQHNITTRKSEADAELMAVAAATSANTTVCPSSLAMSTVLSIPPMTRINHMPMPVVSSDDTKDSSNSEIAIAEEDVVVSLHEGGVTHSVLQTQTSTHPLHVPSTQAQQVQPTMAFPLPLPHSAVTIKSESGVDACTTDEQQHCTSTNGAGSSNNNNNNNFGINSVSMRSPTMVNLADFADWIKNLTEHNRHHCMLSSAPTVSPPDANQSFLNSLLPFLKEMSNKQNLRFRQKVVALIDAILDNAD